jgi:hypothetical protein
VPLQVCHGESNQWQGHLAALVSVACKITPHTFSSATLCDSAATERNNGATNLRQGRRRALSFLVAQVLWFELLASASTGARPRMPYRTWLNSRCIDMTDVMGCSNWIMEVIGDIATLNAQKACLEVDGFQRSRKSAERCLLDGIEVITRHQTPTTSPDSPPNADCQAAVRQAIETLYHAPESTPLRGLVWPICIAGSLASKSQQPLIQKIMDRTARQANTSFGNCGTVRAILQHCWDTEVNWRTAMASSSNYVLLI